MIKTFIDKLLGKGAGKGKHQEAAAKPAEAAK